MCEQTHDASEGETTMTTTKKDGPATPADERVWDIYRQTARQVYLRLGALQFELDRHRDLARGKDDPTYDADLRRVDQLLEQAVAALAEAEDAEDTDDESLGTCTACCRNDCICEE
jgi:hypothetical protein